MKLVVLLLVGLVTGVLLATTVPTTARAGSQTWVQQAQVNDSDAFAEAGLGTFFDNPYAPQFIPFGDCQTYAPFSQPGYDSDGCYGGWAQPTTQWGTFCRDYGNTAAGDCQPLEDPGGANPRFRKVIGVYDSCAMVCGAHVMYRFAGNYDSAWDPPGYSPPAYPVVILTSTQASHASVNTNFGAYLCLDLNDTSSSEWLEICEWTWQAHAQYTGGSGTPCGGAVQVTFDPTHTTSPYMTNWGNEEVIGNDPGAYTFGFAINPQQIAQIATDENARCGTRFGTSMYDYTLSMVEDGIEGANYAGAWAEETNSNTYLRTNW